MPKGITHLLASLVLVGAIVPALTGLAVCEDWSNYTPAHTVGTGKDDWWTAYPDQHSDSGATVDHPDWVIDALRKKPLLILVHSSTCKPCVQQIANLKAPLADWGSSLDYYDVLAEGESIQKAIDILSVYDPKGGASYVPTTIFMTLVKGTDNKVQVAWHSQIDSMSTDQIEGYIKDSVYYHQQNFGGLE